MALATNVDLGGFWAAAIVMQRVDEHTVRNYSAARVELSCCRRQ
jgi:hypothetical protein